MLGFAPFSTTTFSGGAFGTELVVTLDAGSFVLSGQTVDINIAFRQR